MSYAWILPPICDPRDGHLLMDGCYVNNVPGDIMLRESNCSHIIAVDVTAIDSTELVNYGDSLSGWYLLWNRLNPFAAPLQIPTQAQIQVSSSDRVMRFLTIVFFIVLIHLGPLFIC